MPKEVIVVLLIALSGILVGGVKSTYENSKPMAALLGVLAFLAAGGAVAWYVSS
ncbi:hypothetical protein [Actinokineospora pegani]|uniref:hypothetical protein n=1 Tax=Actinokineospora pegani TaxID=2654637 RepID=UPI0018D47019|nr:hypothetical protein [Actinokineospora pegani]